jgi:hypothetical protein
MKAKASSPKTKTAHHRIRKVKARVGPKASAERFLLTFDHIDDPTPDAVRTLLDRLRVGVPGHKVVDKSLPGAVVVEGPEARVLKALSDLPDWSVSREGRLSSKPPAHHRVK